MCESTETHDRKKELEIDAAWQKHRDPHRYERAKRRGWLARHRALQDDLCAYCGIVMLARTGKKNRDSYPTIDHIVPLSKKGPDNLLNTLAACRNCNEAKANLPLDEFLQSPELFNLAAIALPGPDRMSGNKNSKHYNQVSMGRGVFIRLNGKLHKNTVEYCVSEGWVRSTVPISKDRHGHPMTQTYWGKVETAYRDNLERLEAMENGKFSAAFRTWLDSRCFKTGESKDYLGRDCACQN